MSTATRSSFVTKYPLKSLLPSLALFVSLVVTTVPVWADAVIATIPVGIAPNAIAVNSATNKVYVVNGSSNTVTVIDGVTNSATTVAVGTSTATLHASAA